MSSLRSFIIGFVVFTAFICVGRRQAYADGMYTITDLGIYSAGYGINNGGQVAGATTTQSTGNNWQLRHAFRTSSAGTLSDPSADLGTFLGQSGQTSAALAINASGQVTGWSTSGSNSPGHAFRTSAIGNVSDTNADLGTLYPTNSNSNSIGCGINASGQVIGYSTPDSSNSDPHAFRTTATGKVSDAGADLQTLGGSWSRGFAINTSGQVTGGSSLTGNLLWHAFRTTATGTISTASDLGTLGGTTSNGYAINDSGQVAGTSYLSDNVTQHAFRSSSNTQKIVLKDLTTLGYSSFANGINSKGDVVGFSNTQLIFNTELNPRAFLYTDSKGMQDLNTLLSSQDQQTWNLITATSINDSGQITGYGYVAILPGVYAIHAFRLTPNNVLDHTQALKLQGYFPDKNGKWNYQDVDGIVCDNLPNMQPHPGASAPGCLNYLLVNLPKYKYAIITAKLYNSQGIEVKKNDHNSNAGWVEEGLQGNLYYYPPFEFNENQQPTSVNDITHAATRTVYLNVTITNKDKSILYTNSQPIILARPPVVLVHGINSGPENWNDLTNYFNDQRVVMPCVTVNHENPRNYLENPNTHRGIDMSKATGDSPTSRGLFAGNATVEAGAYLLQQRILRTLNQVRNGEVVTDSDQNSDDSVKQIHSDESTPSYPGLNRRLYLSIRRVDVIGWSYGGVITRWYIASKGKTDSLGWYQRLYVLYFRNGAHLAFNKIAPPITYGGDIRKFITLGSMWRGVPLINYLNEAVFPKKDGVPLQDAPVNRTEQVVSSALLSVLDLKIENIDKLSKLIQEVDERAIPTKVPSMEVMAINSPWMSQLIYQTPHPDGKQTPCPFDPNIAYSAVAGDDSSYLLKISHVNEHGLDCYGLLTHAQQDSWFPYLALEEHDVFAVFGTKNNYSDGVVPLWSTAIPGKGNKGQDFTAIVSSNHSDYAKNPETEQYLLLALNSDTLPTGDTLNKQWNTSVCSRDGSKVWTFKSEQMAPPAQNALYPQINGVGRIEPQAIAKPSIRNVFVSFNLTQKGPLVQADITILNTGSVFLPDVQITGATLTPLFPGFPILPNTALPLEVGTINKGGAITTTLYFQGSVSSFGKQVPLKIHLSSADFDEFDKTVPWHLLP